ncbi:hypothetical protein VTJ04DRAFT_1529 [Mycothermus thermophilus]|uniref:uncharacterized protein n=1 Tax=Humicola insolens TaxID=85995 RepID=UPI003744898C
MDTYNTFTHTSGHEIRRDDALPASFHFSCFSRKLSPLLMSTLQALPSPHHSHTATPTWEENKRGKRKESEREYQMHQRHA